MRVRIWKIYHVTIFKNFFDFVENVVDWSDQVIVHFCYFFFKIVQLIWLKVSVCCEEVRKNLMYVSHDLACSTVLHCYDVLIFDSHDQFLN